MTTPREWWTYAYPEDPGGRFLPAPDEDTYPNYPLHRIRLIEWPADAQLPTESDWQPIETAPYSTWVLVWLYLPKNPIASAPVIAQRCYVKKDDPESYSQDIRQTVGCWWANGRYYPAGHVTRWMPLPAPPKDSWKRGTGNDSH